MCLHTIYIQMTLATYINLQGNVVDTDGRISILTGAKTCNCVPFDSVATDSVRAFAGSVEYVLWCEA